MIKCYKCGGYGTHRANRCPVQPGRVAGVEETAANAGEQAAPEQQQHDNFEDDSTFSRDFVDRGDISSLNF